MPSTSPDHVHVVGAGPAGLTGAYVLGERGVRATVLEADRVVGGISRTVEYKGYRFDIGGHRFFTKVRAVEALWARLMGTEMLTRPRLSRIYYRGAFFDYPLRAGNALRGLGVVTAVQVLVSYAWVRVRPITPEVSFSDWVSNRFGRRLFEIFFKTYTEKVWGIPCDQIGAQWAAQRIKGLSLLAVAKEMIARQIPGRKTSIRSLIEEFKYPRLGPGQMWEAFRDAVIGQGGEVRMQTRVTRIAHDGRRVTAIATDGPGGPRTEPVQALLSTMPLRQLVEALDPPAPPDVLAAARRLSYRDFIAVSLIVDQADLFPDTWIYIHEPAVKVGRIQNFKNWSPAMVPDPARSCVGLEYFCFEGDGLWTMADADLVALATKELGQLGLADPAKVVDGTVVRMPKAYPVYDQGYLQALEVLRQYLVGFNNLQLAGRNGLHKYNNQDHSMVTAVLAVRALLGEGGDPWLVNVEDDYHEEDAGLHDMAEDLPELLATQPPVPQQIGT